MGACSRFVHGRQQWRRHIRGRSYENYTRAHTHTHTHGGGLCNTRACIAYRGRAALPPFSPNHACIGATCANISRTSGGGGYLCMRAFGETLRRARERERESWFAPILRCPFLGETTRADARARLLMAFEFLYMQAPLRGITNGTIFRLLYPDSDGDFFFFSFR